MFYIEKNDKLNFFEKKFNIVKVVDNTIVLPIFPDLKEKQLEKLALKTNKIIGKYSNSKKIVLSKEMQNEILYINYLNSYGLEIANGRWLFEILLPNIVEYIVNSRNLESDKLRYFIFNK